jgi:hypothetical protein
MDVSGRTAVLWLGLAAILAGVIFAVMPVMGTSPGGGLDCGTVLGGDELIYKDACADARIERWMFLVPMVLLGAVATAYGWSGPKSAVAGARRS